jgi:hypothetical protein
MPEDMPSSWGYVSSTRTRLKTYIAKAEPHARRLLEPRGQVDEGKGWRAWVKEKRKGGFGLSNDIDSTGVEVVNIFPGWAARRYAREGETKGTHMHISLPSCPLNDVQFLPSLKSKCLCRGSHVLGGIQKMPHAHNALSFVWQRVCRAPIHWRPLIHLQLLGFAGLPKIVESTANVAPYESSLAHLTPQTEERLTLLPPNESDPDLDIEALDRELNLVKLDDSEDGDLSEASSSDDQPSPQRETPSDKEVPRPASAPNEQLHDNLEKRIRCLWYTALPNRTIRLHFLISPHKDAAAPGKQEGSSDEGKFSLEPEDGFLAMQDVTTGNDGGFQAKVRIKWEDLCHHPQALQFAFGETIEDHDLLVVAKLLPQANQPPSSHAPADTQQTPSPTTATSVAPLASITRIPITHSPIRVISDIDDTVKHSGILLGARTVFHNVFVKDMRDNVIPGMGEWYMKMFSQGVRFHYVVSNFCSLSLNLFTPY